MPLYRHSGWVDYTPTLGGVGWAIGNGTISGSMLYTPALVTFQIVVTFGSTSTYGAGQPSLTPPIAPHASWTDDLMRASSRCVLADASGSTFDGRCGFGGGVLFPLVGNTASTYATDANVTNVAPFTWTNPDRMAAYGSYRPA